MQEYILIIDSKWVTANGFDWYQLLILNHITYYESYNGVFKTICNLDQKQNVYSKYFIELLLSIATIKIVATLIMCCLNIYLLWRNVKVARQSKFGTHIFHPYLIPILCCVIVRRAGLLWSQQDFEWRWSVPLFKCLTVLEFSFILFDLCLLITFFNFIMNYVPIVTFWIFTYHKIWILSIMFCSIWSYWIINFLACL